MILTLHAIFFRGEGMGFLQITSMVGSALVPWIVEWLKVFHAAIPFSLMGGLSLTGAVLMLTLPETKGRATFETVGQLLGAKTKGNEANSTGAPNEVG